MIDTLRVASAGYLKENTVGVSVDGYLGVTVIPPKPVIIKEELVQARIIGGSDSALQETLFEEEELIIILNAFLICQN